MREELRDSVVNEVTGGSVVMSGALKLVGFNTIKKSYRMKGDFNTMRNRLIELQDDNPDMGNEEFDLLVRDDFKAHGWI